LRSCPIKAETLQPEPLKYTINGKIMQNAIPPSCNV
jgi:hypothetical protein